MNVHLPVGGIAVASRSGGGKSSLLFGSKYIEYVLIADSGSMGHIIYHKGPKENVIVLDSMQKESPIQTAINLISKWTAERKIFVFDSFSAIQEVQVAWFKRVNNKPKMTLPDHQTIVGNLRDLNLVASRGPGFTLFNTAPGGIVQNPDGTKVMYPRGALVGYAALNGVGPNTETCLSRWTTSWVVCPGGSWKDEQGRPVTLPRGLICPSLDFRGPDVAQYTPLKDPLGIVTPTKLEDGSEIGVHAFPPLDPINAPVIDVFLELIAKKFPQSSPKVKSNSAAA